MGPTRCRDCGQPITQGAEKALSGEWATVWHLAGDPGAWVCPSTGDEHQPQPEDLGEMTRAWLVDYVARYERFEDIENEGDLIHDAAVLLRRHLGGEA